MLTCGRDLLVTTIFFLSNQFFSKADFNKAEFKEKIGNQHEIACITYKQSATEQ